LGKRARPHTSLRSLDNGLGCSLCCVGISSDLRSRRNDGLRGSGLDGSLCRRDGRCAGEHQQTRVRVERQGERLARPEERIYQPA
jgi:hypothetical protein